MVISFLFASADSREAILEKVLGLDGTKVLHIAAGAEHSAVVTGKLLIFIVLSPFTSGGC